LQEEKEEQFIEFMIESGVNITLLGHVTKGKFQVDEEPFGNVQEAKKIYDSSLENLIEN